MTSSCAEGGTPFRSVEKSGRKINAREDRCSQYRLQSAFFCLGIDKLKFVL